jgi:hypothetical protein
MVNNEYGRETSVLSPGKFGHQVNGFLPQDNSGKEQIRGRLRI